MACADAEEVIVVTLGADVDTEDTRCPVNEVGPDVDFVAMFVERLLFVETVSPDRVLIKRRTNICEHCAIQQNKLHVTT